MRRGLALNALGTVARLNYLKLLLLQTAKSCQRCQVVKFNMLTKAHGCNVIAQGSHIMVFGR